ncbi:MAG: hypothetical protein AB1758_33665 [Candidatus Eremiobacterota bacterium]
MRAFSLAEVLVAIFLLAVAVLGLVTTRLYAVRAERAGLERYDLGGVAGSVMASIEAALQQSPDRFTRSYAAARQPVPDMAGVVYSVEETSLSPRLRKFTVTVFAPTQQGEVEFRLWTLVSDVKR